MENVGMTPADDHQDDPVSDIEMDEVAAAMGFGSFGAKPHLNKKRKSGINVDESGSGSNSLPLGQRKPRVNNEVAQPVTSVHGSHRPEEQAGAPASVPETGHESKMRHDQAFTRETTPMSSGMKPDGEWDWHALRRGIRNQNGDMAYYDASFIEDPWRHLRHDPQT